MKSNEPKPPKQNPAADKNTEIRHIKQAPLPRGRNGRQIDSDVEDI